MPTETTVTETTTCEPCECCECCDTGGTTDLPNVLYLHFESTDCGGLNGLVVRVDRQYGTICGAGSHARNLWDFRNLIATGGGPGCQAADITTALFNCLTKSVAVVFGADNEASGSTSAALDCTAAGTLLTIAAGVTYESEPPTCCAGGAATVRVKTTP